MAVKRFLTFPVLITPAEFRISVRIICGLACVLALLAMTCCPLSSIALAEGSDPSVAEVNGQPIRQEELSQRLLADFGRTILDQMINEAIVSQEAERLEIKVSEEDVDAELQTYISKLPVGTPLDRTLREQGTGPASLREQLRTVLRLKKMVESKAQPTDKEIEERLKTYVRFMEEPDQYRISVIFVKDRAKGEKIADLIEKGNDFAEVARTHSDDASSGFGGDLGWRDVGEMENLRESLKQLNVADFKLQKGQMTGLIDTGEGFRIFKITDYRSAKRLSEKEKRAQVKDLLVDERLLGEMNRKLGDLREKAQVVKSPPFDR